MAAIKKNKEIIRNLYENVLNKRNLDALKGYISPGYIGVRGTKGVAGFEEPVAALIKAFPDVQWKIVELIGEGGKVVVKWNLQGTHTDTFLHITATGKSISIDGMAVYELDEGIIISAQVLTDRLGFLQELKVLPVDLRLLPNIKRREGYVHFIDKFIIPENAEQEFRERLNINRNFIRNLPGFINDAAYENKDSDGNLTFLTIAAWENEDALNKAKESVQAEYEKQGFNTSEMLERLNIKMDRGIFTEAIP